MGELHSALLFFILSPIPFRNYSLPTKHRNFARIIVVKKRSSNQKKKKKSFYCLFIFFSPYLSISHITANKTAIPRIIPSQTNPEKQTIKRLRFDFFITLNFVLRLRIKKQKIRAHIITLYHTIIPAFIKGFFCAFGLQQVLHYDWWL